MEVGDVVSATEWWKEMPADWWKEVGENLEGEILARLPAEDVHRYRRVCNKWNILLSSKYFITHRWPDATINKQPQLLLCDLLPNNPSMAYCFYKRTWKPSFSLLDKERNIELHCRGSAAGLVLVADRYKLPPRVCNPYSGNSLQLPPMVAIFRPQFQCIAEDYNHNRNNNSSSAYKVVAIGSFDENSAAMVVEMYDSSQHAWKFLGPIPEHIPLFHFSNFVCCGGSYYCIATRPWSVFGFTIATMNEVPEPNPCISMQLVVPIPELGALKYLLEIQLVTCGPRLLLVASAVEEVINILELESQNKQRHPLSTNNSTTPWAWKEIGRMPLAMLDVLNRQEPPRYKCIGVGDNVCFATVSAMSIEVVVYNLSTRSWTLLPSCPWRNHYWMNGRRQLLSFLFSFMPMVFQPRLDTQVE